MTKDRYPNETPAITRRRRYPVVHDFDFVPDGSTDVVDEILRRAAHGPVWADPSPTDFGVAPASDGRTPGFCRGCDRRIDGDITIGCRTCHGREGARRRREPATPAPQPVEPLTHRCTSCGAGVTTAQSLLPCCPTCGAGAT